MKRGLFVDAWDRFFFAPQSPLPLSVFRILYGALVAATLLLIRSDWLDWYGVHSWTTLETMRQVETGPRLNLFTLIPQTDGWVQALFWVALCSAALLTAGLFTRCSSILVFLCLTSIDQRNLYILHGGDTFLRVAGFFLMFAPAGAALSVDRWIRVRRGREDTAVRLVSPWAQRMIQIEVSLLYFATFCWKMQGHPWVEGTALYYVYHLEEIRRFPVPPWLLHPAVLKLGSWLTLVLELSLGTLIWVKRVRYYVLAAGVLLHLGIEYSLNLPLFEWDILSGYVLFVDAASLVRAVKWLGGLGAVLMKRHGSADAVDKTDQQNDGQRDGSAVLRPLNHKDEQAEHRRGAG